MTQGAGSSAPIKSTNKMTREEIRLQVAISVIQGVLEAKHGVIGEVVPSVSVAIALRIADAFVEEWYQETKEQKPAGGSSEKPNSQWKPSEEQMEVELAEEINAWMDSGTYTIRETARHFYALGLNARKEEK